MSDKHFEKEYSDEGFWRKLKVAAKAAGKEIIQIALKLYYALQSPRTPAWAKTVIIAALGYFIFPIDAVPDPIPVVGYSDDLVVLSAAIGTVAVYIDDDVVRKANAQWRRWFGNK